MSFIQSIQSFLLFNFAGLALLAAFVLLYVMITPYKEFELIKQGNVAASISLGGATLGFGFPLVSSIYFTHSVVEMSIWSAITLVIQLLVFLVVRLTLAKDIEKGSVSQAVFLAAVSVVAGMINAVSISY